MSYDYGSRVVWLDDLDRAPGGAVVMCAEHAERLNVPNGWVRRDRRTPEQPMFSVPIAV